MLSSTVERVPRQTADDVSAEIQRPLSENVAKFAAEGPERLWASRWTVAGLPCPPQWRDSSCNTRSKAGAPPLPVFRRLGVRRSSEIEQERYALKALRGDFRQAADSTPEAALRAVRH
jgi:hypothetical protein